MNFWRSHRFSQNITKNPDNFCSYFGRNDDFINLFWNLLTFKQLRINACFRGRINIPRLLLLGPFKLGQLPTIYNIHTFIFRLSCKWGVFDYFFYLLGQKKTWYVGIYSPGPLEYVGTWGLVPPLRIERT